MKYLLQFVLTLFIFKAWSQSKPNIVIFITDDQNQTDAGCYGNGDVRTPNMDRLASEGMKFNHAYAASSMCSPSRSVMLTGKYPFRNGCQMNHFAVRQDVKNLPQYLKSLGYRVVLAGKTHFAPESWFPFEYIGREFGKYEPVEGRTDPKKETVTFIKNYFKKKPEQPLCLIVAPWLPHVPWMPNHQFDPAKIKVPAYLADTKETRAALASYYQSIVSADNMLGEVMGAVDGAGAKNNTVFMWFSDQGVQFPGAKWTVYDRGLRVPFVVRWPGKVAKGSSSDALISLVDLTPTLVDLAGGKPDEDLDGKTFKNVLLGKQKEHRKYVFAETSVEPHYWYNYVPSRSVITDKGLHYIRNYYPGVRFLTHIDKVERNMFYFDSWVEQANDDEKTKFLLNRYSFRPPEELYDINNDTEELSNLAGDKKYAAEGATLKQTLEKELDRQGETEEMILQGSLPLFYDRSYEVPQHIDVFHLSFDRKLWNPDTLFVTAHLSNVKEGGIICDYFNQFQLSLYEGRIGLKFSNGQSFRSDPINEPAGHIQFKLAAKGDFQLLFNGSSVIADRVTGDFTKIKPGYVSCGQVRGKTISDKADQPFAGKISNLRFTMNDLNRTP